MSRKNQVVFIGRVFVMVGIVLAVVSISLLLAGRADPDAVITQGTVVDQVPHLDGRTYYMVVEYTDESTGESHEVVSNYSTNRPAEVGSQVPVEYVPGEVGSARVATWASKWLGAAITGGLAVLFLVVASARLIEQSRGDRFIANSRWRPPGRTPADGELLVDRRWPVAPSRSTPGDSAAGPGPTPQP